jgi:hypothetical protein
VTHLTPHSVPAIVGIGIRPLAAESSLRPCASGRARLQAYDCCDDNNASHACGSARVEIDHRYTPSPRQTLASRATAREARRRAFTIKSVKRRSQRAFMSWEKFTSIANRFFPSIRILHPLPCHVSTPEPEGRARRVSSACRDPGAAGNSLPYRDHTVWTCVQLDLSSYTPAVRRLLVGTKSPLDTQLDPFCFRR